MNIYDKLDVKRYINACATITAIGGSIMDPRVLEAMSEASRSFVTIMDLQKKAGAHIAKITNNEAAMVSNGAAAGMVLAIAASIAGDDYEKRAQLPYSNDMKNEVLVYKPGRVGYGFAIKQAGGKLVGYGDENNATAQQLEAAITDKTAAIFIFYFEHQMDNQVPVQVQAEIAHRHGLPLIIDAAAQLPNRENLWRFTRDWGADLAIFSGGKGLCGPQSSGLVLGKKELVDRMVSFSCPNGGIGRPMKVGKEEIVGLMRAVELYLERDAVAEMADYEAQVAEVVAAFSDENTVTAIRDFPNEAGQPLPRAKLTLGEGKYSADPATIAEQLKLCEPGVFIATGKDTLYLNPQTLQPGEMTIVIDKVKEVLGACRV